MSFHYFQKSSLSVGVLTALFLTVLLIRPLTAEAVVYQPGETLNPSCLPTDPTCFVALPSSTATTTTSIIEGSNLYYTDARSRNALSLAALGLSYATSTGAFSLTSGYEIPLIASTTNWNSFYNTPSSRITTGVGLSWAGNMLNVATSTLGLQSSTLASANILVGNGANQATSVALSGDATLANTGAITLANTGVATGSYGGSASIPTFTVDSKGRLTAAGTTTITTTNTLSSAVNSITSTVNGVLASAVNLINSFTTTLSGNTLTTTVNGVSATSPVISSNSISASGSVLTSTINGIVATTSTAALGLLTTNVAEGTNLYYTQNRFDTALLATTTSALAEGTNQYFTNARVNAFISASSTIPKTYSNNTFSGTNAFNATTTFAKGATISPALPDTTANTLYNQGGALYFNGSALGIAGSGIQTINGLAATGQTFATTSDANIGISITSSGSTHTFASSWNGTLAPNRGGTGTTTAPTYGKLLIGNASSGYDLVATSTLGLLTTNVAEGTNLYYTQNRFDTALLATTTSALAEGNRLYYTDARSRNALSLTALGLTYATSTGAFSLASGYTIPLTASTTDWGIFRDTPSARITAGTGLAWSGNILNASTGALALASATQDGIVSTTTQSFAGNKIFTGATTTMNALASVSGAFTGGIAAASSTVSATSTTQGLVATFANIATSVLNTLTTSVANITTATIATLNGTNATFVNATTTNATSTNQFATNLFSTNETVTATSTVGGLKIGALSGLLFSTAGNVSAVATSTLGLQSQLLGTQGQVAYFSGTNTPSASSVLFITPGGNVGVGTTTPARTLDVSGTFNVSAPAFSATGGVTTTSGSYTVHTFTNSGTFTVNKSGTVEVLVVAGGGGGGGGASNTFVGAGGGGGAGGVVYTSSANVSSGPITVTVGAGGTGGSPGTTSSFPGSNGGNSAFGTIVAVGGGYGGGALSNVNGSQFAGGNGGSGGGAGTSISFGGSGTSGQGNNGGNGATVAGGGGGGAITTGQNGWDGVAGNNGNGGAGISNSITGTATMYGGGGGANTIASACTDPVSTVGLGGSGGGGNFCVAGTNGLGGGGGGGVTSPASAGGNGGSGVVIVRYLTASVAASPVITTDSLGNVGIGTSTPNNALSVNGGITLASATPSTTASALYNQGNTLYWNGSQLGVGSQWVTSGANISYSAGKVGIGTTTPSSLLSIVGAVSTFTTAVGAVSATGGTITTSGLYTVHTFTSGGTFMPNGAVSVEYLVVAGGGGGGASSGAGGGAGGFLTSSTSLSGATTVTVGTGGVGGVTAVGASGSNSVLGSITATGGGGGASNNGSLNGSNGGSGGGATGSTGATAGTGISGQGFAGGVITSWSGVFQAAGGGGAGAVGGNGNGTAGTGTGGVGLSSSISGTATFYAGGGGGGSNSGGGSAGGNGGGGAQQVAGTANTGGGGGGGGGGGANGANGGSGIVIVRYLTSATTTVATAISNANQALLRVTDTGTAANTTLAFFEGTSGQGCIIAGATGLSCSSDITLKHNVQTLGSDTLGSVLALKAVTYDWNNEVDGAGNHIGFIAQDVEKLFPGLVITDPNGKKALAYDRFAPILTKAIQELSAKVDALTGIAVDTLKAGEGYFTRLFTKEMNTEKLCIGAGSDKTCVTKTELDALLKTAGTAPAIQVEQTGGAVQASTSTAIIATTTDATIGTTATTTLLEPTDQNNPASSGVVVEPATATVSSSEPVSAPPTLAPTPQASTPVADTATAINS